MACVEHSVPSGPVTAYAFSVIVGMSMQHRVLQWQGETSQQCTCYLQLDRWLAIPGS